MKQITDIIGPGADVIVIFKATPIVPAGNRATGEIETTMIPVPGKFVQWVDIDGQLGAQVRLRSGDAPIFSLNDIILGEHSRVDVATVSPLITQ